MPPPGRHSARRPTDSTSCRSDSSAENYIEPFPNFDVESATAVVSDTSLPFSPPSAASPELSLRTPRSNAKAPGPLTGSFSVAGLGHAINSAVNPPIRNHLHKTGPYEWNVTLPPLYPCLVHGERRMNGFGIPCPPDGCQPDARYDPNPPIIRCGPLHKYHIPADLELEAMEAIEKIKTMRRPLRFVDLVPEGERPVHISPPRLRRAKMIGRALRAVVATNDWAFSWEDFLYELNFQPTLLGSGHWVVDDKWWDILQNQPRARLK